MTADEKEQLRKRIVKALRTIRDPEIPVNIYDLGLIYELDVLDDARVHVRMTLTAPGCPVAAMIVDNVRQQVSGVEGVSAAEVELVWEPAWTKARMSEAARLELNLEDGGELPRGQKFFNVNLPR